MKRLSTGTARPARWIAKPGATKAPGLRAYCRCPGAPEDAPDTVPDDVPDEALADEDGCAGAADCEARGDEGAGVAGVPLPGRLSVAMSAPRSSGGASDLPDDCAGAEGMGIRGESPTAGSGTPDES